MLISGSPLVISIDSGFQASNVWCADGDEMKFLTSLNPPIPRGIFTGRAKCIFLAEKSLLIIAFDAAWPQYTDSKGAIRTYNISNGTLEQEVLLRGLQSDEVFTLSHSSTYLTVALAKPSQSILYRIHSQGLVEIRLVSPSSQDHLQYFFPIHVGDDGSVLTSTTFCPCPSLLLHFHPSATTSDTHKATLTLPDDQFDWLVPSGSVIITPTYIIIAISGSSSAKDHQLTMSSVCALLLPSLSTKWKVDFKQNVKQLSYHNAFGIVVILHTVSSRLGLTFLDVENGCIVRNISILPQLMDVSFLSLSMQCTDTDQFVCVLPSGKLIIEPLQQILEISLLDNTEERSTLESEAGVVLKMHSAPVKLSRITPRRVRDWKAGNG